MLFEQEKSMSFLLTVTLKKKRIKCLKVSSFKNENSVIIYTMINLNLTETKREL